PGDVSEVYLVHAVCEVGDRIRRRERRIRCRGIDEPVSAGPAGQLVGSAASIDVVVAAASIDRVVGVEAVEEVGPCAAVEWGAAGNHRNRLAAYVREDGPRSLSRALVRVDIVHVVTGIRDKRWRIAGKDSVQGAWGRIRRASSGTAVGPVS